MKIIFFGSDDFAKAHLETLLSSEHKVVACVTQPDKPKGRGLHVVMSPIKESAQAHQIPFFQPESLKNPSLSEQLKEFKCDLFIVIAYGKILPAQFLQIPYVCAINVHGSFLPKYRGAAPINWAIINGEDETGISIIKMNATMDGGDIFAQEKIKIDRNDTAMSLRAKMMAQGPELLLKTINSLEDNNYTLTVQDSKAVTVAAKLTKELGHIDWNRSAHQIHNLVRGLNPWPSAYTFFKGKLLKILSTDVMMQDISSYKPGEIIGLHSKGFVVATMADALLVKQVHLESAKVMEASQFCLGHHVEVGFRFE